MFGLGFGLCLLGPSKIFELLYRIEFPDTVWPMIAAFPVLGCFPSLLFYSNHTRNDRKNASRALNKRRRRLISGGTAK